MFVRNAARRDCAARNSVVARQRPADAFRRAAATPANTTAPGGSTPTDEEVKLSRLLYSLHRLNNGYFVFCSYAVFVKCNVKHVVMTKCRTMLKYLKTYALLPVENNGTSNYSENLLPETELGHDDILILW